MDEKKTVTETTEVEKSVPDPAEEKRVETPVKETTTTVTEPAES